VGFAQGLVQCLPHGSPDGAGLALDLALQPTHDGALALDGAAHALELAGVGIAPRLADSDALPSLAKVCFRSMPASLAASTSFVRAVSSRRLSVGWAMALCCTVLSTITRA
jgi:hypothetical protein